MPDSPASSLPAASHDTRRPFVVVTGLSGAGRVTALHVLDDMGYVAVDNVPLPLLGDLMRSTTGNPGEMAAPLAFGSSIKAPELTRADVGQPLAC